MTMYIYKSKTNSFFQKRSRTEPLGSKLRKRVLLAEAMRLSAKLKVQKRIQSNINLNAISSERPESCGLA